MSLVTIQPFNIDPTKDYTFGKVASTGVTLSGTSSPITLNTAPGSSGQILTSAGPGATPIWVSNNGGSGVTVTVDNFTGNGSQTSYTLGSIPASINYTIVNLQGVFQLRGSAYTLSGAVVTFSSPPPNLATIEITTLASTPPAAIASGSGTATLNFGAGIGSNEASVVVTGLTTILGTATVQVYVMAGDTSSNHTASDHRYFPLFCQLTADTVIAGTGFTVYGRSLQKLTGTWTIRYKWSN